MYLDFRGAFDSVSHKRMLQALHDAGVDNRSIAITKSIYEQARVFIQHQGTDGQLYKTKLVDVNRGVVQGCPFSATAFVTVVEWMMREFDQLMKNDMEVDDSEVDEGNELYGLTIAPENCPFKFTLKDIVYVDDFTTTALGKEAAQKKIDLLIVASAMADLVLRPDKCVVQRIGPAAESTPATYDDIYDLNLPKCDRCGQSCVLEGGLKVHRRSCKHRDDPVLVIEPRAAKKWKIERVFGRRSHRWFAISYNGTAKDTTWNIGHGGQQVKLVRAIDIRGKGAEILVKKFWQAMQHSKWQQDGS